LLADHQHAIPEGVNFRERLICPTCGLNTRQRLMAHLLKETVGGLDHPPRIYLYEQVTPFFQWARTALPGEVIGSEYLGHDVPGGAVVNGVRHEDALALSFEDASLDVIISQEVLEHVPQVDPAVAETARVLRPGGRFLFTIPFHTASDVTVQRAKLVDGEVVHLMTPDFHGNPVSSEGSLVFFDHGWDVLDRFRSHGFDDVSMLSAWSALYGYLGGAMLIVFSATRSAAT
jgi:SAM-dependent methyltransferase